MAALCRLIPLPLHLQVFLLVAVLIPGPSEAAFIVTQIHILNLLLGRKLISQVNVGSRLSNSS